MCLLSLSLLYLIGIGPLFLGLLNVLDPIQPNHPIHWPTQPPRETKPLHPNIILIVVDDWGANDASYSHHYAPSGTNHSYTPHLDLLAKESVIYTQARAAACMCAPSRAALMTGRYPTRFGYEFTPVPRAGLLLGLDAKEIKMDFSQFFNLPSMNQMGMPGSEVTIAEYLREEGYETALIGKWHLGRNASTCPAAQGFDNGLVLWDGMYGDGDDTLVDFPIDDSEIDVLMRRVMRSSVKFNDEPPMKPSKYLTDYFTDEAVKVIKTPRTNPFFLYLAHWGVHNPLQATKEDVEVVCPSFFWPIPFPKEPQARKDCVYKAMIHAIDRSVKHVLKALEETGKRNNTLIIFTSDNGGARYLNLSNINDPYQYGKLSFREGGLRIPLLVNWPNELVPQVVDEPVSHLDLFPTITSLFSTPPPAIDGHSLFTSVSTPTPRSGLPTSAGESRRKHLFWKQGNNHAILSFIGRKRTPWKLIRQMEKRWLFALKEDPTEHTNLATRFPDVVRYLDDLLDTHIASQAPPSWPSVMKIPIEIDGEIMYFPN